MPWLSLPDYARRTGTPESTVRALIRAGRLEAHRESRAPGDPREVWKILVDEPAAGASSEHPQASADSEVPQPLPDAAESPSATLQVALAPLVDALNQERGERRRLAAENADLRERVGRAEARAEAAERRLAELERRKRAWWHFW